MKKDDTMISQERHWDYLAELFRDGIEDKLVDYAFGYYPSWLNGLDIDYKNRSKNVNKKILDFGCGQGGPARMLKKTGIGKICGVDTSSEMIKIAKQKSRDIEYHVIHDETGLPFKEDYFDGVMANYVFLTMSDHNLQLKAAREIHRVLKNNAPFIILINNPDAIGVKFVSVQSGEPEMLYKAGDSICVKLFKVGEQIPYLKTNDIFWPKNYYITLMQQTGFKDIFTQGQTLTDEYERFLQSRDIDTSIFQAERKIAPALYIVGHKGNQNESSQNLLKT